MNGEEVRTFITSIKFYDSVIGANVLRIDLPVPSLEGDYKKEPDQNERSTNNTSSPASNKKSGTPSKSRTPQQNSYSSFPETDPWGSPELHKGHNHSQENSNATQAEEGSRSSGPGTDQGRGSNPNQSTRNNGQNSWVNRHAPSTDPFRDSGIEDTSYTPMADDSNSANPDMPGVTGRNVGGSIVGRNSNQTDEVVTVTPMPEKEGIFLFQHRNYDVSSVKRNSRVTRRYSDFVWLLDCLHKRYPFRQLPLLPPKRVASK